MRTEAVDIESTIPAKGPGNANQGGTAPKIGKQVRSFGLKISAAVIIVVAWAVGVQVTGVSSVLLPSPWSVVKEMIEAWPLFFHAGISTVTAIVVGYLSAFIIGFGVSVAMVYSRLVKESIYPVLLVAQIVPKVALAPLFIIWFGFGGLSKIIMVALICFFPIVVDTLVGLLSTRPESLTLVRSMGATRWQAFWKVRVPWSMPNMFAGLKVAMTLAVVGAVVAEFVGSDSGLGVVLVTARGNLDTVRVFASIGWLTVLGIIFFLLVTGLERLAVGDRRKSIGTEAAGGL